MIEKSRALMRSMSAISFCDFPWTGNRKSNARIAPLSSLFHSLGDSPGSNCALAEVTKRACSLLGIVYIACKVRMESDEILYSMEGLIPEFMGCPPGSSLGFDSLLIQASI